MSKIIVSGLRCVSILICLIVLSGWTGCNNIQEVPSASINEGPALSQEKKPEVPLSQKALEGSWQMISISNDPVGDVKEFAIFFTVHEGSYTFTMRGDLLHRGRLRLNMKAEPAELDMLITEGEGQGGNNQCIARFHEGNLQMCMGLVNTPRPSSFEDKPDSGISLAVFERVQAEKTEVAEPE
ncbi:MAG: hypothetical protein COA78_28550 [Blastopirellula sp.]|nr:MAG: hypothetical protein COA78_28550 [Blastopirellula sp.]